MLSAVLRMRLYVEYYGLTTDRFFPLVFMGWLAVVLILLTVTVLRDQGRVFLAGAALIGLATLAALNVANPDAIIARVNLDRSATTLSPDAAPLDVAHLATLGGDAAELAAGAVISPASAGAPERCAAARALLSKWDSSSPLAARTREPGAWRAWNAGERRGLAAIARNSGALREVVAATCTQTPPAASR
jgi:two-component system sensor histidine kinase BaeS